MKPAKQLWRVSIITSSEAEDAVAELLGTILNCNASSYFDVEPQTSVVSVYFSETKFLSLEVREEILAGLKRIENCGLKIGAGKVKIAKVRREDWAESWKRHFKPIEIGDSLLVKPSWSKKRPRKNQAIVILDPGLSFGTGQHPTTEFCLHQICRVGAARQQSSRRLDATKSFLDIGTGSGILAIAAAKLGCKPVRAIDFDPEAVRVARANARVNGVLKKIKIVRGDATKLSTKPKEQFDLVCANLISNLLIAERKKIVAQLKPGGVLVLAGILKSEFLEVQKAFESLGLKLISSRSKKEWRSGSFCFA
jgi:ribosomal protein L11 methyltransferase